MSVEFEYLGIRERPRRLSEYRGTWDHQREVHARVASGELGDQVIFCEHEPVYTAGRRTRPEDMPFDGTPVVEVDRGGEITWHGPEQLVGYPIILLPGRVGVVDHVRRVEQAVIDLLAGYGIHAGRVPGRTGVWLPADDPGSVPAVDKGVQHKPSGHDRTGSFTFDAPTSAPTAAPGGLQLAGIDGFSQASTLPAPTAAAGAPPRPERKICAIGVRVARRTTMHGFALNVNNTMAGFDNIVPCGISDAGVTSMAAELGHSVDLLEVAERLEPLLAAHLTREGNLNQ